MRSSRFIFAATFGILAAFVMAAAADEPPPVRAQPVKKNPKGKTTLITQTPLSDEQALAKANLTATDAGKLIEYLQQRTLTDSEQGRIEAVIKRFGSEDFDDRVRATDDAEVFGSAAISPLKTAMKSSDPEVAYRARLALKRIETIPHSTVAAAAVRAVVKLKPDGAVAALIGFLPLADDESVADLIRDALVSLAVAADGKGDPALIAALADVSPIRRSAAYVALTKGGAAGERIRIKDAYPKVREAVGKESDTEAKFAGLWNLALITREKEFVADLISLIPKLSRGRIWQLEDLLLQLATTHPKDGRFLRTPAALEKSRDAWLAWWKEKGGAIDLTKLDYKPRVLGYTDMVLSDPQFGTAGRVVSLGLDLKERWRLSGTTVMQPADVVIAPDDRVFVVETNYNRIGEFKDGKLVKHTNVNYQPLNLSLLPDGGQIVFCRNQVFENDKTGKQVWTYPRNNQDIMSGCRLPNGDVLVVTINNQGGPQKTTAYRLDSKGKETGKTYTFGQVPGMQTMDASGKDKVLVCEFNKVAEYDLETGKQTWKYDCNAPGSCQRLANGNVLIAQMNYGNGGRIIEVDPSGEIVWDYEGKEPSSRINRAYRR